MVKLRSRLFYAPLLALYHSPELCLIKGPQKLYSGEKIGMIDVSLGAIASSYLSKEGNVHICPNSFLSRVGMVGLRIFSSLLLNLKGLRMMVGGG